MNPSRNKHKHRLPLGIFILIVGVAGMAGVALLCAFTLKFGSLSFLKDANSQSEYVKIEEVQIDTSSMLSASLLPTEMPTEQPTPEPTEVASQISVSKYSTLRFGDDNADVERLNARLMELGYMDYDETFSNYNNSTEMAICLFQRANDMMQTGIATGDLQELLFADNAQIYRVKINDDGADVKSVQERLLELGYYTDKISGYFGPQTEMAVRLFQSKNSIAIDGQIDRDTNEVLYSGDAIPLATPTPTPTSTPMPIPETTPAPAAKTAQATAKATKKPTVTLAPGQTATPTPKATATPKPTPTPKPQNTFKAPEGTSFGTGIEGMIACAQAYRGAPYVYGASGPDSFDCSGFVCFCMKQAGFSVSRASSKSLSKHSGWALVEKVEDLRRGDLVFFHNDKSNEVSHVAICTGGRSLIHASSSAGKIIVSTIGTSEKDYWYRNFVCGRRVG